MKPIVQLEQSLINKIAAGEVVERPLSVVKELTENAIDAGASVITVEIKGGGLTSIRVTDNGSGIPSGQLDLAFSRHATSKIKTLDDLFSVGTMGFRGEALYSIAAVSQVELLTKTRGAVSGARAEVHGGQFVSNQAVGCPDGTTIIVANLFYNTPARRKFLKKDTTEAGYVGDCMQRLALGNPGLSFRFINDGKLVMQTNGSGGLQAAILAVYGRRLAAAMVHADVRDGDLSLEGFIGKPETARGNRQYSNFFINGRYIQSRLLQRAAEDAMKTMLPSGKFPAYVLDLKLPPDALDVNVHPTKMDVRFEDEEGIFSFVRGAVYETLTDHALIPEVTFKPRTAAAFEKAEDKYEEQLINAGPLRDEGNELKGKWVSEETGRESFSGGDSVLENANASSGTTIGNLKDGSARSGASAGNFSENGGTRRNANAVSGTSAQNSFYKWWEEVPSGNNLTSDFKNAGPLVKINTAPPPAESEPYPSMSLNESAPVSGAPTLSSPRIFFYGYKILGLLFGTYWLVAQGESMYVIDQHAAHERILYEEILSAARSGTAHSQPLLTSVRLKLTPGERQTFEDNRELFERFGFEIEPEEDAVLILAVPFLLRGPLPAGFFTDLLDKMDEAGFSGGTAYEHKENALATMACKAAVKANDILTEAEAEELIRRMLALENPFTCPHGRPTVINISKKELERKFKRS